MLEEIIYAEAKPTGYKVYGTYITQNNIKNVYAIYFFKNKAYD